MIETLPLAHLKAHLSEVVDRVEREHDRVVLTRNGRPAFVSGRYASEMPLGFPSTVTATGTERKPSLSSPP
jgi:hypothetical protein